MNEINEEKWKRRRKQSKVILKKGRMTKGNVGSKKGGGKERKNMKKGGKQVRDKRRKQSYVKERKK